jgi:hypothetical protein
VPDAAPQTEDRAEEEILALLDQRGPEKTICPSEVARALADGGDFHPYMEPVREAADRLAKAGRVEVTQKGRPVTIDTVRGPIRIGLPKGEG